MRVRASNVAIDECYLFYQLTTNSLALWHWERRRLELRDGHAETDAFEVERLCIKGGSRGLRSGLSFRILRRLLRRSDHRNTDQKSSCEDGGCFMHFEVVLKVAHGRSSWRTRQVSRHAIGRFGRYKAEAAAGAEVGALASWSNNHVVVLDHYCRESWMSLLRV